MNKRGDLEFLQKLILILIGTVLLISVIGYSWLTKTGEEAALEKCRNTALIIDKGRDLTSAQITKLDCSMRDIEIGYKDVTLRGELSQRMLFRPMAEAMRDCWYVMGDGTFKPFYQKLIGTATSPCVVCARISFDPKIAKEYGREASGFQEFLNETMLGSNNTYFKYMDFDQWGKSFTIIPILLYWLKEENTLKATDTIDLTSDYYVVYNVVLQRKFLSSDHWLNKWWNNDAEKDDWTRGGVDDLTLIYLVRSESLSNIGCDYIANEIKDLK